jgi:CRISPR-associated protein Csd1
MILQALTAYYGRLLADGAVQPQGFQEKEIPWVVELAPDGRFLGLISTGGEDGRGRKFVVPAELKRAVNIAANLLWDNPEYVFGWPRPGLTEKQATKVPKRHESFVARLHELPETVRTDPGVSAVINFLETADFTALQSANGWEELRHGNANVSFRLSGDAGLVCERPAVRSALSEITCEVGDTDGEGWCLVTGRRIGPTRLHPSIKGVRGARSNGASLVSFNLDAFTSHGWSQGANAPVGQAAVHAYTAALNRLLSRGNERHRLIEGDTTFVFWAAASTPIEDQFAHLLGSYAPDQQESDGTPVRETFDSVRRGLRPSLDDETPFYVLGLAPNAARLAVRFWHEGTVAGLAHNILRHFDDVEVVGLGGESNLPGIWRLIGATARDGDARKIQDNLRGQLVVGLMASILDGMAYPATLLARPHDRALPRGAIRMADPRRSHKSRLEPPLTGEGGHHESRSRRTQYRLSAWAPVRGSRKHPAQRPGRYQRDHSRSLLQFRYDITAQRFRRADAVKERALKKGPPVSRRACGAFRTIA